MQKTQALVTRLSSWTAANICAFFFEKNTDSRSQSKTTDKLSVELQKLMTICQEKLYYAYKLWKQAYNKGIKPRSYALSNNIWLNSKYIKTKQNQKLEAKHFKLCECYMQ